MLFGIGCLVGVIILLLTVYLKIRFNSYIIQIPALLGLTSSVGIIAYSYFVVRGFEGGAIGLLGFIIFFFSVIALLIKNKRKAGFAEKG
ncbi:YesK family protein [Fictibacillus aquaticus]|nr:YesK family protein [Fictibacillus aquaticus]